MTDKLVEYILEINANPKSLAAHVDNPEQSAINYGLSSEDVKLVANEDKEEIKKRFEASNKSVKGMMLALHS